MKAAICDVGPRDGLQNEPEPLRAGIATEDLVYLLHGEGVETGIDLGGLIAVAAWLEKALGRELPGQVYRAEAFAPVAG